MRYIIYNSKSELASFMFEGFRDDETALIPYPEMPSGTIGKIGRGIESIFPRSRIRLYPDAKTRSLLKKIAATDTVLFFAMENIHNISSIRKYIRARSTHVFLWNPVARLRKGVENGLRQIAQLRKVTRSIYTFDHEDAIAYALKSAPQPYRAVANAARGPDLRTFYFSGVDKERLPLLLQLKHAIDALGLTHLFHVVPDKGKEYAPEHKAHLQDHWIAYARNLAESQNSSCLIEIIQHHQSGPTLRSMEALFLQKKIITNRPSARDDAFYDPDRVLVIEKVDAAEIGEFMRKPFAPVDPALLLPHEIHAWIRNVAPLGAQRRHELPR